MIYERILKDLKGGGVSVQSKRAERIGAIRKNNQGLEMRVINYANADYVEIVFPVDGTTMVTTWKSFTRGRVRNHNYMSSVACRDAVNRIGMRIRTDQGCWAEIVSYNKYTDVKVRFDPPYSCEIVTTFGLFKRGSLENPMFPSVFGVGYKGIGPYVTSQSHDAYSIWHGLLSRCYNSACSVYPIYGGRGVKVDPVWHDFQAFAKWFDENRYLVDGEELHLDKDMFGRKLYGPDSSVLLPSRINASMLRYDSKHSCIRKRDKGFSVSLRKPDSRKAVLVGCNIYTYDEAIAYMLQSRAVMLDDMLRTYTLPGKVRSVIDRYVSALCAGRKSIDEFETMGPGEHGVSLDFARERMAAFFYENDMASRRIGERRIQRCGSVGEIVEYRSSKDIDVRFDSGFVARHCVYGNFVRGGGESAIRTYIIILVNSIAKIAA